MTPTELEALETARQQGTIESLFVPSEKTGAPIPDCYRQRRKRSPLSRCGRAVNLPEMSRAPQVKVFYGQLDLIAIATRIAGTLFPPRNRLRSFGRINCVCIIENDRWKDELVSL